MAKNPSKVFVYIVDMDRFTSNSSFFCKYLSDSELKQANKYYNKILRERYIVSHTLLRYILSDYIKQSPEKIQFSTNEYGKPFLEGSSIRFNMSHSHNMVAYIITFNNNIGIDIEFNDNKLDIKKLFDLVLTPRERIIFDLLKPEQQASTFYNLWTKKEALTKAIGIGLSYPLSNIEALSIAEDDKIFMTSIDDNITHLLYTYSLKTAPNFSGAIATEKRINEIIYYTAQDINRMITIK